MFTLSHQLVEQNRAQHQALLEAARREQLLASLMTARRQPQFGYRVGEWLVHIGEWLKARYRWPAATGPSSLARSG